jgi:hypothetical protein
MSVLRNKAFFIAAILLNSTMGYSSNNDETVKHQALAAVQGTITVDILAAGRYRQYTLHPVDGTVTRTSEQQFSTKRNSTIPPGYLKPTGAILSCTDKPEAMSPDGRFVATCESSLAKVAGGEGRNRALVITDRSTKKELFRWAPSEYRDIGGFAWAPDSKSIAVLNESEHYGKNPLELFLGLSGHPVPHNTVFVELFITDGWKPTEYVIQKDVISPSIRILDWKK